MYYEVTNVGFDHLASFLTEWEVSGDVREWQQVHLCSCDRDTKLQWPVLGLPYDFPNSRDGATSFPISSLDAGKPFRLTLHLFPHPINTQSHQVLLMETPNFAEIYPLFPRGLSRSSIFYQILIRLFQHPPASVLYPPRRCHHFSSQSSQQIMIYSVEKRTKQNAQELLPEYDTNSPLLYI